MSPRSLLGKRSKLVATKGAKLNKKMKEDILKACLICLQTSSLRYGPCILAEALSETETLLCSVAQILRQLHPQTLLNLSWTSKSLHAYLMNKSSAPIWRACLKNVPGLPRCPQNLIEPVYAALMFSKHCMVRTDLRAYIKKLISVM